jgi:hypothetical protein
MQAKALHSLLASSYSPYLLRRLSDAGWNAILEW